MTDTRVSKLTSIDQTLADQLERLNRAVEDLRLSPRDYRVLWLFERRTQSTAEIAAILRSSPETVQRSIDQLTACGYLRAVRP
jgi:DNA-binding MarR family transcriptional regulator